MTCQMKTLKFKDVLIMVSITFQQVTRGENVNGQSVLFVFMCASDDSAAAPVRRYHVGLASFGIF